MSVIYYRSSNTDLMERVGVDSVFIYGMRHTRPMDGGLVPDSFTNEGVSNPLHQISGPCKGMYRGFKFYVGCFRGY